jgi:2-methylisocitrate lyase-like PEP mutase family enzyme
MLGTVAEELDDEVLAPYGVKIALRGHGTFNAAVKAIYDSLQHQARGGKPAEVVGTQADSALMGIAISSAVYKESRNNYLGE